MPAPVCSTGISVQFKCWAKPLPASLPRASSSVAVLDLLGPLLFVTDSFQTRTAGCVLGLHVHDSVKPVLSLSHGRHHPEEVDLSAGRGNVGVITLRHQDAIALAHHLDQLGLV